MSAVPPKLVSAAALVVAAAGAIVLLQGEGARGSVRAAEPGTAVVAEGARWFLTAPEAEQAARAGMLPDETRSVLRIEGPLRHGEFIWQDNGVPQGPLTVRVNLTDQTISVFRAGHEIGAAVILYGASGFETPPGQHPILAKLRDHRSSTYDAPMPYTLRLTTDGVAVHGSDVRRGFATHGCIGVPLPFARRLFEQARVGDVVDIVRTAGARG